MPFRRRLLGSTEELLLSRKFQRNIPGPPMAREKTTLRIRSVQEVGCPERLIAKHVRINEAQILHNRIGNRCWGL